MRDTAELTREYLKDGKVVQIATSNNNMPWVCSVYYVVDDELNIYWLSYPSRRHSQDIAVNSRVALTLAVKTDLPVIGVQAEGVATEVNNIAVVAKVIAMYVKKYGAGKQFLKNFKLQKNKHVLYCFTPSRIVLFDEENFGRDNAQEFKI